MIGIKNQQFGVEIEFTCITRREAATALADKCTVRCPMPSARRSRRTLAEISGVSRSLISVIEAPNVATNFSLDIFFSLCDALDADPADQINASVFSGSSDPSAIITNRSFYALTRNEPGLGASEGVDPIPKSTASTLSSPWTIPRRRKHGTSSQNTHPAAAPAPSVRSYANTVSRRHSTGRSFSLSTSMVFPAKRICPAFVENAESQIKALTKQRTILNVQKKKRQPLFQALTDEEALPPAKRLYDQDHSGMASKAQQHMDALKLLDAVENPVKPWSSSTSKSPAKHE